MNAGMEDIMEHVSGLQISRFFLNSPSTTQQQCDQEAERITGGPVHPTTMQGAATYTVLSNARNGGLVVQFRHGGSVLDLDLLGHAKQTYGSLVPRLESAYRLGELNVYTMDNVGGVAMYLARKQLQQHDCYLLHQTVQDFAIFFASAWHNTPSSMVCPDRISMFVEYSSQLSQLACGLPERFLPCLHNLMTKLPRLFAEDWPLVPNHNDLLENNIHVEPETGEIVGICGWNNATIGPFGVSLGSIETIIGMRKLYGWCYHDNYLELRGLFWEAFYDAIGQISLEQLELIELATLVGIFLRHGFEEDDKGNMSPAKEGSVSLDYLDSVTLGIWVWTEH